MLAMLLDGAVLILLVGAIALGLRLQRRLAALRHGGGELQELIECLGKTVDRAETALAEIKGAAHDHRRQVEEATARAEGLRADLSLLSERGEREADRLASLISDVRKLDRSAGASALPVPAVPPQAGVVPGGVVGQVMSDDARQALERTLRSLR